MLGQMEHTSEDLSDLGAGTYSVVVTDENGCSVSIEVEITESDAMTISETHSDYTGFGVSCNGATDGSIDVTVTGGTGLYICLEMEILVKIFLTWSRCLLSSCYR